MPDEELRLLDTRAKLFDAVLRLWAHQDTYVWSRARIIVGIQGAVLAAAYTVGRDRHCWPPWSYLAVPYFAGVLQCMVRGDDMAVVISVSTPAGAVDYIMSKHIPTEERAAGRAALPTITTDDFAAAAQQIREIAEALG
jgi:hypothetical protein